LLPLEPGTRLTGWTIWSFSLGATAAIACRGPLRVGLRRLADTPSVPGDALATGSQSSPVMCSLARRRCFAVTLEVGRASSLHLGLE